VDHDIVVGSAYHNEASDLATILDRRHLDCEQTNRDLLPDGITAAGHDATKIDATATTRVVAESVPGDAWP
jgi:hypothetical protein